MIARALPGILVVLALGAVLLALTVPEHTTASRWRRTLGTLDPAQVREIHVGPRRIDDPAAIREIVARLNVAQPYRRDRSDGERFGAGAGLVILERDGTVHDLTVLGRRRASDGLLVMIPAAHLGGWNAPSALVPGLPAVLDRAGAPLPER